MSLYICNRLQNTCHVMKVTFLCGGNWMCLARQLLGAIVWMLSMHLKHAYHLVIIFSSYSELIISWFIIFLKYWLSFLFHHIGPDWIIANNVKASVDAGLLTTKVFCLVESLFEYRYHDY